jgi:NADPH:quinone reductase-like Zn-dependent oxidoreductase
MAKQVLLRETGPADVLKIEEVPTPEPKAGEVRIRVKAVGLNRSEVNLRAAHTESRPSSQCRSGLKQLEQLMRSGLASRA